VSHSGETSRESRSVGGVEVRVMPQKGT
jgi:hypothetical protein